MFKTLLLLFLGIPPILWVNSGCESSSENELPQLSPEEIEANAAEELRAEVNESLKLCEELLEKLTVEFELAEEEKEILKNKEVSQEVYADLADWVKFLEQHYTGLIEARVHLKILLASTDHLDTFSAIEKREFRERLNETRKVINSVQNLTR